MQALTFERMDFGDEAEIDVKGDSYKQLINVCFKYACYFSFTVFEKDSEDFRPYIYKIVIEDDYYRPNQHYKTYYYRCCIETKQLLINPQYSLFYWTGAWLSPQNITFYRSNGSVLLSSVAHDQNCYVFIENEDIEDFSPIAQWTKKDIDIYPNKSFL